MKKLHIPTLLYCLLFCLLVVSCKEKNQTAQQLSHQNDTAAKQLTIKKTQGTDKYDNVQCSLMDKAGNLWFGTTGEGVYCWDGKYFVNFTIKDGLCNNNIWSMLEDTTGVIWFGTSDGVCTFDGKSFHRFLIPKPPFGSGHAPNYPNDDPSSKAISSLLQDHAGNIWIGTNYNGVYRLNARLNDSVGQGKLFTNFLSDDSLLLPGKRNFQAISCMMEDKQGKIWFGSWNRGGAYRYDSRLADSTGHGKYFTRFTMEDGLCDNMIRAIFEDKSGNILFSSRDHGVCSYDGKTFTAFSQALGLPNNNVCCMLQAKNGELWFGTDGKMDNNGDGVYRYDGKTITHFTTKDGLSNDNIFSLLEDRMGNIWIGTRNVGLCRYNANSPARSGTEGRTSVALENKFTDFSDKESR